MSVISKWFATLSIVMLMLGCADVLTERQGIAIDVVPIKHSYSIEIKNDLTASFDEIDRYIQENWAKLSGVQLELVVHSSDGEKLAKHVKQVLRSKGKDPKLLSESMKTHDGDFDFTLVSFHHQTITPICDYYQIGTFGETSQGCFSEGARWQSIVHPDRASQ
jgi:hypothetical protein